jgi:hypothetical protein
MGEEANIVWSLKEELALAIPRLHPWRIADIGVDSDGSYRNSRYASQLEPMISMPIRGFFPDLVCSYESPAESGIAAFEVKASFDDWVKGITQARAYREGVHRSFLAVPEGSSSRYSVLERDARESGVGVWLLRKSGWEEVVPSASPRPSLTEAKNLAAALRGVVLPKRLQLNHPLNYLAVVWAATNQESGRVMEAMEDHWPDLRSPGSRQHALNGARYLGLLSNADSLTRLGLSVADLLRAVHFETSSRINKRARFADESPGLAAVMRMVLVQQESTRLIVDALERSGNGGLNTEELLRKAAEINPPLASGLFLANPRDLELPILPSSAFSPSFVFQFKQTLWHSGILSTPIHKTAGKGAEIYNHQHDHWKLENHFAQSV